MQNYGKTFKNTRKRQMFPYTITIIGLKLRLWPKQFPVVPFVVVFAVRAIIAVQIYMTTFYLLADEMPSFVEKNWTNPIILHSFARKIIMF